MKINKSEINVKFWIIYNSEKSIWILLYIKIIKKYIIQSQIKKSSIKYLLVKLCITLRKNNYFIFQSIYIYILYNII